jgi:hypothetical protein
MAYRLFCTDRYGVVRTRAFETFKDADDAFALLTEFTPRWICETIEGKDLRGLMPPRQPGQPLVD